MIKDGRDVITFQIIQRAAKMYLRKTNCINLTKPNLWTLKKTITYNNLANLMTEVVGKVFKFSEENTFEENALNYRNQFREKIPLNVSPSQFQRRC